MLGLQTDCRTDFVLWICRSLHEALLSSADLTDATGQLNYEGCKQGVTFLRAYINWERNYLNILENRTTAR